MSIKRNITIGYMKESAYVEKSQNKQENTGKIVEITQEKLIPHLRYQHSLFSTIYPKTNSKFRRHNNFR